MIFFALGTVLILSSFLKCEELVENRWGNCVKHSLGMTLVLIVIFYLYISFFWLHGGLKVLSTMNEFCLSMPRARIYVDVCMYLCILERKRCQFYSTKLFIHQVDAYTNNMDIDLLILLKFKAEYI